MSSGEETTQLAEILYVTKKLENAVLPEGLREKIDLLLKRVRRMARQGQAAGEYEPMAKYIDWCLSVPWGRYVQDNLDLGNAKQVMDSMHYGSEDVKQVILEYLALLSRKKAQNDRAYVSPVLAFVGVQGAGKTTLARAIAQSLGRPFYRLSLSALGDASELRGAPYGSISAQPGQIVKAIVNSRCLNPVILLDEFDKISGQEASRKDFMAILLEVLDPQQNSSFRDWYIDYPIDLSKVLFIATANRFKTITRELLDRIEFIEFKDYTQQEKVVIAQKYLYPQVLQYAGLQPNEFQITDDAWPTLVASFGKEQGVRRLERNLQKTARKVVKQIALGQLTSQQINGQNAAEFAKDVLPEIESIRNIDYTESINSIPDQPEPTPPQV